MGVKVFLLVVMVLLASCHLTAATSARLDSIRADVYLTLGLTSTSSDVATPSVVNKLINYAQDEVCRRWPAYFKDTTIKVNSSTVGTTISNMVSATMVFKIIGYNYMPLKVTDPDSLFNLRGASGSVYDPQKQEDPRYYWTAGNIIYFHPKPNPPSGIYDSFKVTYQAYANELTTDTSQTLISRFYWHVFVLLSASYVETSRGNDDTALKFRRMAEIEAVSVPMAQGTGQ